MLKVTVGSNTSRDTVTINPETKTPRQVLTEAEVKYERASVALDGCTLKVGQMDQTFTQLGITGESCSLIAVIKGDSAA